jgi:hypothetical protein
MKPDPSPAFSRIKTLVSLPDFGANRMPKDTPIPNPRKKYANLLSSVIVASGLRCGIASFSILRVRYFGLGLS